MGAPLANDHAPLRVAAPGGNMIQFFPRISVLALLLFMLGGCLTEANQGGEADAIVKTVHQGFKSGNWKDVMPLYDQQFLNIHPASIWQRKLAALVQPLGKLKHIKQTFNHNDPRFGGDFYMYGFLLQFEHGTISETLTIYDAVNKKHMTISGHELKLKRHPS